MLREWKGYYNGHRPTVAWAARPLRAAEAENGNRGPASTVAVSCTARPQPYTMRTFPPSCPATCCRWSASTPRCDEMVTAAEATALLGRGGARDSS